MSQMKSLMPVSRVKKKSYIGLWHYRVKVLKEKICKAMYVVCLIYIYVEPFIEVRKGYLSIIANSDCSGYLVPCNKLLQKLACEITFIMFRDSVHQGFRQDTAVMATPWDGKSWVVAPISGASPGITEGWTELGPSYMPICASPHGVSVAIWLIQCFRIQEQAFCSEAALVFCDQASEVT